jgi:hypothetical protein
MELPPKPDEKLLASRGWKLTGKCRTPDTSKHEYWAAIPLQENPDQLNFPNTPCNANEIVVWISKFKGAVKHKKYGTKRWIVEPIIKTTIVNKKSIKITDKKRMDWLTSMCVEVRTPLPHGSSHLFHAMSLTNEEDPCHKTDLRKLIDIEIRKS